MKTIRILTTGCFLLLFTSTFSGCATPHESSPCSHASKSDSDDLTGPQKVGSSILFFLESIAYSLGEEGYSFTP